MTVETIQISRNDLYEQVWSEPMTKVASQYGLSDVGVAKICRRLNIPRPGRGYWAKKRRGRPVARSPLPALKDGRDLVATITKRRWPPMEHQQTEEVLKLIACEQDPNNRIHVPNVTVELPALAARTAKSLRGAKANDHGLLVPRARNCLDVEVSEGNLDRAIRIMNALVIALESRGFFVSVTDEPRRSLVVAVLGEVLEFGIEEIVNRKDHVFTSAEQKKKERDSWSVYLLPKYDFVPSGRLVLKIKNLYLRGIRMTWSDGKIQRIEDCLNDFVCGLIHAATQKRLDRLERERQKQEWEKEQQRRQKKAELIEKEEERVKALETDAENWRKSQSIRAYIEAVRMTAMRKDGGVSANSELAHWLEWATQQADRLDPLVESPPSILDEKDEYRFW